MANSWPRDIDNSEYWHCMFSGSATFGTVLQKCSRIFFFFLIQSYKSTESLLDYSAIFSKTNALCYFIQPMQLCGKTKLNLQCMNG